MKHVAVIGAGPAGLVCAIAAASAGARVTLFDAMKSPGKKLLMTGSGRCNLSNTDPDLSSSYHSSSAESFHFSKKVFSSWDWPGTKSFFEELGLLTVQTDNLVYPASFQAASVLSVLLFGLERHHVTCRWNSPVTDLSFDRQSRVWTLSCGSWPYKADAVVLCCGSKAHPETGSDGSGYLLAGKCGHHIIKPLPALCALVCKGSEADLALVRGCRSKASVYLSVSGKNGRSVTQTETGEIQWTTDGISGICVFNLSGTASEALEAKQSVEAVIDLLPGISDQKLSDAITTALSGGRERLPARLSGIMGERILEMILRRSFSKELLRTETIEVLRAELIRTIRHFTLSVTGTRGFEACQVCRGGVSLDEINPETMESRLCPELFFAGEITDMDAPCGGYNLQWAWSTGLLAGKSAARQ